MKLRLILGNVLIVTISSCTNPTISPTTTISGRIINSDASYIYLNRIDHFDYLNNDYVIDSTTISANGEFQFVLENLESELVSLTTHKFEPYTYQILKNAPETYYYGNCEKFFTAIPTLYIFEEQSIQLNWLETPEIDSISSPDNSGLAQIRLREYYLNSRKVDGSSLNYDQASDFELTWNQMRRELNHDLIQVDMDKIIEESSLENYLYTEIYLGHLNEYLNWFEQYFPDKVNEYIRSEDSNNFYSSIFSEYQDHSWNARSFEYYKFSERFVNHQMNLQKKSFKNYYQPSREKLEIANETLNGKNQEKYLRLLEKQLETDL